MDDPSITPDPSEHLRGLQADRIVMDEVAPGNHFWDYALGEDVLHPAQRAFLRAEEAFNPFSPYGYGPTNVVELQRLRHEYEQERQWETLARSNWREGLTFTHDGRLNTTLSITREISDYVAATEDLDVILPMEIERIWRNIVTYSGWQDFMKTLVLLGHAPNDQVEVEYSHMWRSVTIKITITDGGPPRESYYRPGRPSMDSDL